MIDKFSYKVYTMYIHVHKEVIYASTGKRMGK